MNKRFLALLWLYMKNNQGRETFAVLFLILAFYLSTLLAVLWGLLSCHFTPSLAFPIIS